MSVNGYKKFKVFSRKDITNFPEPEWLIHEILPSRSISVLYGSPGVGKTFTAISMAASVCSGRDFLCMKTIKGNIVYVSAEGSAGLNMRLAAWEEYYKDSADEFSAITDAPQLGKSSDAAELINSIQTSSVKPKLIVIDTLARCLAGGDENGTQDMSAFINSVEMIKNALSCAVLIVHHSTKSAPSIERGSSVLRGAADTMTLLTQDKNHQITFKCDKQKEAEQFGDYYLKLVNIEVNGKNSCVMDLCSADDTILSSQEKKLLLTLWNVQDYKLSRCELSKLAEIPEGSMSRHIKSLMDKNLICVASRGNYQPTEEGKLLGESLS